MLVCSHVEVGGRSFEDLQVSDRDGHLAAGLCVYSSRKSESPGEDCSGFSVERMLAVVYRELKSPQERFLDPKIFLDSWDDLM